jgi:hypothetical protein
MAVSIRETTAGVLGGEREREREREKERKRERELFKEFKDHPYHIAL